MPFPIISCRIVRCLAMVFKFPTWSSSPWDSMTCESSESPSAWSAGTTVVIPWSFFFLCRHASFCLKSESPPVSISVAWFHPGAKRRMESPCPTSTITSSVPQWYGTSVNRDKMASTPRTPFFIVIFRCSNKIPITIRMVRKSATSHLSQIPIVNFVKDNCWQNVRTRETPERIPSPIVVRSPISGINPNSTANK